MLPSFQDAIGNFISNTLARFINGPLTDATRAFENKQNYEARALMRAGIVFENTNKLVEQAMPLIEIEINRNLAQMNEE